MSSEVNFSFSLLFLMIVYLLSWINSSVIEILIIRGVWSKECQSSGRIVWLSNSKELGLRNMRLITEFELFLLFKYLVGKGLVEYDKNKSKVFAMSTSISLWIKWKRYEES